MQGEFRENVVTFIRLFSHSYLSMSRLFLNFILAAYSPLAFASDCGPILHRLVYEAQRASLGHTENPSSPHLPAGNKPQLHSIMEFASQSQILSQLGDIL